MNFEVAKEAELRLLNVFSIKYKFSEDDDFQTNRAELLSKLISFQFNVRHLVLLILLELYFCTTLQLQFPQSVNPIKHKILCKFYSIGSTTLNFKICYSEV